MYYLVLIDNQEQIVRLAMDEQRTYQLFTLTHSVKTLILNNQWALEYFGNKSNYVVADDIQVCQLLMPTQKVVHQSEEWLKTSLQDYSLGVKKDGIQ